MANTGGKEGGGQKPLTALIWAFLERCAAQGVGIAVNIVLARLLTPDDYGVLAIMVIFTNLANQMVQTGFNTALIQNKDVTDEDYSSVLHVSMFFALALYALLYFAAPIIAQYYKISELVRPFRVLALILFPGTLQSIQTAKLKRELNFRRIFRLTITASISGGMLGVIMAYCGFGVWALVGQQLCGAASTCVALYVSLRWLPQATINWARVRVLFSYGWKLLAASALNTLYNDLTGLIIGKKYNTTLLAYYNRGQELPSKLLTNISGSIDNVMLPALAREQENRERCKQMMRRAVQTSCFVIFPMMAGLAAVARPLIQILFTEKWLSCVPFMQLSCLIYAFNPVASANLQAMNAMGRSDMFLKLEIIKKVIGLTTLAVTVFCFRSVFAIMVGTAATVPLGLFVNAAPNKKIVGYSFSEQMLDIFPQLLLSTLMFFAVYALGRLELSAWAMLAVQVPAGIAIYVAGAKLFRLESFTYVWGIAKSFWSKMGKKDGLDV